MQSTVPLGAESERGWLSSVACVEPPPVAFVPPPLPGENELQPVKPNSNSSERQLGQVKPITILLTERERERVGTSQARCLDRGGDN